MLFRSKWLSKSSISNITEVISEWACIEHEGFARRKAVIWWMARTTNPCPPTIDEALEVATSSDDWKEPIRMKAHKEGRFWRIDEVEMQQREASFTFGANAENDDIPF